jgi:biotin carboxylase
MAVDRLLERVGSARVSVIDETAFIDRYPEGVTVRPVPSVRDVTAVREAALNLHREDPVDRVVAGHERCLQAGGYLRSFLALPGMGYEIANLLSNKAAMKTALQEAGLPVAPFRVVPGVRQLADAAGELGWPVVVKPAVGAGCLDTFAVHTEKELRQLLDSPRSAGLRSVSCSLLVERFLPVEAELHCDGIVWSKQVEFVAVSRYFQTVMGWDLEGPRGSYTVADDDPLIPRAQELHTTVVKALGLDHGVTHLELFQTATGLVIGEIAGRPAGGGIVGMIWLHRGVDLWNAYLDTALGIQPDLPSPFGQARSGITACSCLPIRPGRVTQISTAQELAALPGVLDITMTASKGDLIEDRPQSSHATTGLALLQAADETELKDRLDQLHSRFVLETDPS